MDRTRPAPSSSQAKAIAVKTGKVNESVKSALQRWRSQIFKRDFEDALFAPSGILSDERIDSLSSVGSIGRLNELERVVGADWPWFGQYGDALLEELKKLNIPPMQPKPQQKRAEKRTVHERQEASSQEEPAAKKKRGQKQVAPSTPTPVNRPALPVPTSIAAPHPYAMPQHYATPQHIPYNPYSFMQYAYAMPAHPPPPFYGYFQTPMQPPRVPPNPTSSNIGSQNPNPPSSSAGAQNGGGRGRFQ